MFEGASYLSDRRHRDCAFRALGSIAWADGDVTPGEQKLFQAYLAKPYAEDEQTWFHLASEERVAQSQMLARWPERDDIGGVRSCLTKEFKKSDSEHRISLLGHLYTMLQVDGNEGSAELDVYEDYRDGLDGSGFFDGSAIDLAQLTYVERAVKVSTNPNIIVDAAADEHIELTEDLLAEETLEFLAETPQRSPPTSTAVSTETARRAALRVRCESGRALIAPSRPPRPDSWPGFAGRRTEAR